MKPFQNIVPMLRRKWIHRTLCGAHYSSDYAKMDAIYMVEDPWRMTSPSEAFRFAETNRLIIEKFGRVDTLLEIGCGEGHQSLQLRQVCTHLIGLDVSARALERARMKCPGVEFLVGDVFSQKIVDLTPFDLVVACEVLYYMSDVPAVLRRMQELGCNGLVTYFAREMDTLDPLLLSLPGAVSEIVEFERTCWRAVWWHGEP